MDAKLRAQVAIVMRESGSAHLLVEDVVRMMRTRFPRDYARTKVKDMTRSVAPHVSAYRKKQGAVAAGGGGGGSKTSKVNNQNDDGDHSDGDAEMIAADRMTPKFNIMNQGMRRRYTSTKVPVGGGSSRSGGGSNNLASSFSAPPTSTSSASDSATASLASARGATPPPPKPTSSSSSSLAKRARRSRSSDGGSRSGKRQRSSSSKSSGDNSSGGTAGNLPGASSGSSFAVKATGRYADLGGIETCMQEVRELIEYPLSHPEIYAHLGVEPPRGILLHGPPGCGKTTLANAIAGELGVAFLRVSAPEIVSGMSGQSEEKVRKLFEEAIACAPSLIFIDEIDAITPKRATASRGMERRIVAQLLTCMDSLNLENTGGKAVMVIGATNTPDSLDSALRRAGRFDREICMSVPDKAARERILQVLCAKLRLEGQESKEGEAISDATLFDYALIAKNTPGFVGADLVALTKEAAVIAVNRIFRKMLPTPPKADAIDGSDRVGDSGGDSSGHSVSVSSAGSSGGRARSHSIDERIAVSARLKSSGPFTEEELAPLSVTMEDFMNAVKKVQPSAKREGFATTPDVTWDDIGALGDVRADLEFSIMQPIRNPERFEAVGLQVPAGVLLYGPPGCGKTMLAKAIAHESGANFISVKGPELLDKYVGESEKAVRQVFHRAQMSSPCVIFFDELDALCPKRGSGHGGGGVSERVVNQLLTELDGMESRRNVFVIAATNRPDIIDAAMLRPGRLDKLLYVPLPSPSDRVAILHTLVKKSPLAENIDIDAIARDARCSGYSGADVSALVREATIQALRDGTEKVVVTASHFGKALDRVPRSVTVKQEAKYLRLKDKMSRSRLGIQADDAVTAKEGVAAAAGGGAVDGHSKSPKVGNGAK